MQTSGYGHNRSLDHLVGAQEDRRWDLNAERAGGLQVDDQLELDSLLDRHVGDVCTSEDLVSVRRRAPRRARRNSSTRPDPKAPQRLCDPGRRPGSARGCAKRPNRPDVGCLGRVKKSE